MSSIKTKKIVLDTIQQNREAIRSLGAKRIGLFGSLAREEENDASDLDFIVELNNKSFDSYMELKKFLEDLFDCNVDLVLENTIKPRLRDKILKEVIYAQGL